MASNRINFVSGLVLLGLLSFAASHVKAMARSPAFSQDCIGLAANLGNNCNATAASLNVQCCKAVDAFNQRGCFCNGAITGLLPAEDVSLLTGIGPTVLQLCAPLNTTIIQPSAKNCPAEATTPGVCGVPDWQIDQLRFGFFNAFLTNATDHGQTLVPNNTDFSALLSPYVTDNTTIKFSPMEGTYQGLEELIELLTYTLANYNDGAVLFDFHLVGLPIFASADSIVGNVSTNTTVPAPMNGPALFSSGDTTDTFVNITYEPCSGKVASWVQDYSPRTLYMASKARPSDANLCSSIQKTCTGANKQYDSVIDCINFFNTLPEAACANKVVLGGNCKNCRFFHYILAKTTPEVHCFHIGKGLADPSGHVKCSDTFCAGDLTAEAIAANSTRAVTLKKLASYSA